MTVGSPKGVRPGCAEGAAAAIEDHPGRAGRTTAGLVAVVAALGAAGLTLLVAAGHLDQLDESVRAAVLASRSPAGVWLMTLISHLGSEYATIAIVLVLAYWMWRRHRQFALHFVVVAFTSTVWQVVLKRVLARPRPWPPLLPYWHGAGYPSGHTLTAVCIALLLLLYLERAAWADGRGLPERHSRGALGLRGAIIAWPLLMALSRVYIDAHWAADVAGGLALGIMHVAAWYYLAGWRTLARE